MHATKLANLGVKYLTDLQLNDLCQLRDQLDTLWKNGQSKVPNNIYDKVADGINYEITQLKTDAYDYVVKKTDDQLKKLVRLFNTITFSR